MKKILAFLALGFLLGACSDKLTSSKAEDLVEESLKEKPMYGEFIIYTGDALKPSNFFSEEKAKLYDKLNEDGYLKISVVEKPVLDWRGNPREGEFEKFFSISLTDKSKDYLLETKKSYSDGAYENTMRTYTAEVEKVSDIHIIPEMNMAEAKATFVKKDKTPFFIFEEDQTEFLVKNVGFQKTEDKGWTSMRKTR